MTCPSCKSTWNTDKKLDKCPLCGASLTQTDDEIRTVADAIKKVVADRGLDVLKTPKVIKSMVSDFVHDCDKEKRLLSYVIDSGAFEQIRQVCSEKNPAQRSVLIQKIEQRIMDYALISPELTQHILSLVFEGLNIPYETSKPQSETKVTPTTTTPTTGTPMTAEEMYKLGERYYYGKGEPQDYKKAVEWFEKAAKQGHNDARFMLGHCYYYGHGVAKNAEQESLWHEWAFSGYASASRDGDPHAMHQLGICYQHGWGVPTDRETAWDCYQKAADHGYAAAQYMLGQKCEYSRDEKAVEWYQKAAAQGFPQAQYRLGEYYYDGRSITQSYTKAVELYLKAAKQGNADAQYKLGFCYENGQGVPQSYTKAEELYLEAAKQGNANAQCSLGTCYYSGSGVAQNFSKAAEWYGEAAKQGHADAQCNLGTCYYRGIGVMQNTQKAEEWWKKASAQGNTDAKQYLKLYFPNSEHTSASSWDDEWFF